MTITDIQNAIPVTGDVPKGLVRDLLQERYTMYFASAADLRGESPTSLVLASIVNALYWYDSADVTTADSGGDQPAVLVTTNGRRYKALSQFAPRPNLAFNGDFRINQRGAASYTASGLTLDRWRLILGSGSTNTISQVAGITQDAEFALSWDRTVAGSAATVLEQRHEDVRAFAGKTVVISFDAIAVASTVDMFCDFIQTFGSGGSSPVDLANQTAVITTTLQRFSFVFDLPSVAGKTFGPGALMQQRFFRRNVDQDGEIHIGNFKLEIVGPNELPLQTPHFAPDRTIELARCQHYFERIPFGETAQRTFGSGYADSTTVADVLIPYARKRATPSISTNTLANVRIRRQGGATVTPTSQVFAIGRGATRIAYTGPASLTAGEGVLVDYLSTFTMDIDAEI